MKHGTVSPHRLPTNSLRFALLLGLGLGVCAAWGVRAQGQSQALQPAQVAAERSVNERAQSIINEGRRTFRFDTFGSEAFWGQRLRLHEAIAGAANGGVGSGVSPKTALAVGLKIDLAALPDNFVTRLKEGRVNLDDPANTLALLKLNAVVGLTGKFDQAGTIRSIGIQCALCHSDVDDSLAPGIGKRLDGWANRDLNVGAIVSLAPNLSPYTQLLGVDAATVRKVLLSWGPGRYDALLDKDGKAFRPDGKQAGTLIPPAFGLAGINLHTWTGFGSVPYWNAYVAVTRCTARARSSMSGSPTPISIPLRPRADLSIRAARPTWLRRSSKRCTCINSRCRPRMPPAGSFNSAAAARGEKLFNDKAQCATCHVPPLFTEPGHNLHSPAEMGIDAFQANRSPTHMYRTAPLAGLWTHQKGGFFHDGRFATLRAVLNHYDRHLALGLTDREKADLEQYLRSL